MSALAFSPRVELGGLGCSVVVVGTTISLQRRAQSLSRSALLRALVREVL